MKCDIFTWTPVQGPMEAANDFELSHKADFVRTDWCRPQPFAIIATKPNIWIVGYFIVLYSILYHFIANET